MSSIRFDRVAALFRRASRVDADRRPEFLRQVCGGDSRLRREVLSLLRHGDAPPEGLGTGEMVGLASTIPSLGGRPPSRIGPYRILDCIGEGGMGIVYRAEQESPIRRTVAIKLVKGFLAGREASARLESERQALALMNHPNIARVYDAGATSEGRPWFIMELIEGSPITAYCETNGLGLRDRLELLVQVCDGVQHAHRNAVIHRDIKPSNVLVSLVDGHPVPKIIDFGVAKALDRRGDPNAPRTETGQFLGTPEYVSPEQSIPGAGPVDTRTDVYSLGVILYELLTGRRPFSMTAGGIESLLRRIREQPPVRPSAAGGPPRRRELRGDLDWIAMKALEKDPARRYATPADLAADISRHLRHEPIAAGPPGTLYRLGRLIRRHRAAALLTFVLASVLTVFAAVTATQSARLSREAERANRQAAASAEMVDFLLGLFANRTPSTLPAPAGESRRSEIVTADKIRGGLAGRPLLRARLLHSLGEAYRLTSRRREALPILQEAHESLSSLVGRDDPLTIGAAQSIGELQLDDRQFEASELLLRDVYETRRRLLGGGHPDASRSVVLLGYLYKTWGRNELAAEWLSKGSAGLAAALGRDDPQTLIAERHLVGSWLELRRFPEARTLSLDLLQRMSRVLDERDGHRAIALYNLGLACANLGERAAAIEHLSAAVDLGFSPPGSIRQDPLLHPLRNDPAIFDLERRVRLHDAWKWPRYLDRVETDLARGRFEQAEARLQEILGAARRIAGEDSYPVLRPMLLLADLRMRQGRFDEAERTLLARLDHIRKDPRAHPTLVGETLRYLVECELGRGRTGRALERLQELEDTERPLAWQGRDVAYLRAMRAGIRGDRSAALEYLGLAVERGYSDTEWLSRDLCFRSLRDDPAFRAILDRASRQID